MPASCIEIVRLLLLCCLAAQSCQSLLESEPSEETANAENDRSPRNFWPLLGMTNDTLAPDLAVIGEKVGLSASSNLHEHPTRKIIGYPRIELSPLETRPLLTKKSDGNTNGQEVNVADDASQHVTGSGNQEQNYVRVAQGEISHATDERNPLREQEVDLSFLDDLGGLAHFLLDYEDADASDTLPNEEAPAAADCSGFFGYIRSILGSCNEITSSADQIDDQAPAAADCSGFFGYIRSILGSCNEITSNADRIDDQGQDIL